MTRPRQTGASLARDRDRAGVIAVELTLAVLVMILAAWLGVAALSYVQHRHRCDQLIADLGDFSDIFQAEARRLKTKTATAGSEITLPPAVEQALDSTHW